MRKKDTAVMFHNGEFMGKLCRLLQKVRMILTISILWKKKNFFQTVNLVLSFLQNFVPLVLWIFKFYFPIALVESIVEFTNVCAVSRVANYTLHGDRHGAWVGTRKEEMYSLLTGF